MTRAYELRRYHLSLSSFAGIVFNAAVTAAAVADALRPWRPTDEPHWSDDKTTALDATAAGDRS